MEWCRIERVEELDYGGEFDLKQDLAVNLPVQGFDILHGPASVVL